MQTMYYPFTPLLLRPTERHALAVIFDNFVELEDNVFFYIIII